MRLYLAPEGGARRIYINTHTCICTIRYTCHTLATWRHMTVSRRRKKRIYTYTHMHMYNQVYLPYARYLASHDRFEEAQEAYRKAGKPEESIKMLEFLSEVYIYVCMYVCICLCMYVSKVHTYVCIYVCMNVHDENHRSLST